MLQIGMAGLPISTYKYAISYSDDNITYGAYSAYADLSSIATSFSIGNLNNGRYYKIKARAVNALGDGEESQEIGPFVPVYAASAAVAAVTSVPNAVAPNRGVRTFTVTVTPPSIVNFSYAVLQTQLSGGAWTTREANITNTGTTSYTYSATASQTYSARLITYNTDGYSETTVIASNISIPALIDDSYVVPAFAGSGYHPAVAAVAYVAPVAAVAYRAPVAAVAYVAPVAAVAAYWDDPPRDGYYADNYYYDYYTWGYDSDGAQVGTPGETGTFTVTGNAFSQTSTYSIPSNNVSVTNLVVEAYVVISGITITTSSRRFYVDYSGVYSDGRNSGQTAFDALASPHSTTSGANVVVRRSFNVANIGYDRAGAGRVTVRGGGTIGTWSTSPDQRIRVKVKYGGQERSYNNHPYWVAAFAGSGYHAAVAAVAEVQAVAAVTEIQAVAAVAEVQAVAAVAAYWDNPPYAQYTVTQSY